MLRTGKMRWRCVRVGLLILCLLLLLVISLPEIHDLRSAKPANHRDYLSSVSIDVIPYLNLSSQNHHLPRLRNTGSSAAHNASSLYMDFPEVVQGKTRTATKSTINTFHSALSPEQKDILLDVTRVITSQADAVNITYVMYSGTLLGSFRHHDVIPWDDDVDLLFPFSHRTKLFLSLKELLPSYKVVNAGPRVKFYSAVSKQVSKYPWGWPYVDVHFYRENETHIWDAAREFTKYAYKKLDVFPLHRRPLGSFSLKAPRDSFAVLRATYTNLDCETYNYSHKFETLSSRRKTTIPCTNMMKMVPFVHRTVDGDSVRETLKLGDQVIHSTLVDEPTYAITNPYSLRLL